MFSSDDDPALEVAIEREYRDLVRYARLRTGSATLGEELAHDALERLCIHWGKVKDHPNLTAWLLRTVNNLSTSLWRRRRIERAALERIARQEPNPAPEFQEQTAALSALKELTERQRTAIALRHIAGLTSAEAANVMGCSASTVRSTTEAATARLRSLIGETEDAEIESTKGHAR